VQQILLVQPQTNAFASNGRKFAPRRRVQGAQWSVVGHLRASAFIRGFVLLEPQINADERG
jgi:hypothetical protein